MSRFGACSARISGDRHTHRTTTITLAAHARRGLTTKKKKVGDLGCGSNRGDCRIKLRMTKVVTRMSPTYEKKECQTAHIYLGTYTTYKI